MIIFCLWVFTPALTGDFSLKLEWQQVSIDLHISFGLFTLLNSTQPFIVIFYQNLLIPDF